MIKTIKNFYKTTSGNITIATAAVLPLVVTLGLGVVEYNVVLEKKMALQDAADLAAINALHEAHLAFTENKDLDFDSLITQTAKDTFADNIKKIGDIEGHTANVTPSVENNLFKIDVDFTGNYDSALAGLIGMDTFQLAGSASATVSASAYVNVTLLFDVSSSMGIPAYQEGMDFMGDTTVCSFACHMSIKWATAKHRSDDKRAKGVPEEFAQKAAALDFEYRDIDPADSSKGKAYFMPLDYTDYEFARFYEIDTRLDVAKTAAINAINGLSDKGLTADQVTFNVASFDNEMLSIVENDDDNSGDFEYINTKINDEIQFKHWHGGTNIPHAVNTLLASLPEGGSGKSADDRLQYVVILSDGVQNTHKYIKAEGEYSEEYKLSRIYSSGQDEAELTIGEYSRRDSATQTIHSLSKKTCEAMDEQNVKPLFLLTNYILPEVGGSTRQKNNLKAITPHVEDELLKCVGDKDSIIATDTPKEIEQAFVKLFAVIASPLRLN